MSNPQPWEQVKRYNCDCLEESAHGGVAADDEQGFYCQRWVYLA